MNWRPLGVPLYVRLWLAVVAAIVVLAIASGWLLRDVNERRERPLRNVVIKSESGEVLGQTTSRPTRVPGQGVEFNVAMNDGRTLVVQIPPRARQPGDPAPAAVPLRVWARTTQGLWWLLALVSIAVAVATYPIVRRLTRRLESLRDGVERWGAGDLSTRVGEEGADEIAQLARRFNHAAARVEALVASHKSLLANASHELRSPLARIRMSIALSEPPPPETVRREIERNIAELDQLVGEILLASRLDAKESDVGTVEPVDLTGLAAEEAARTGAELLDTGGAGPVVVPGVSKLLRRAVRNLLENARRHSGGGPVEIEVRRDGAEAMVRVRDHGPGVPPAERERIFEPFYRLPGASERDGGVGLGLALVRSIAERHGGNVRCEDAPDGGRGACFVLRLSVAGPQQATL